MKKKLVISDLDGTLLDKVDRISENYARRLNLLIDKGLDFTICTGRDFEKSYDSISSIHFKNPIILTNGALMVDYPSGIMIDYLSIPKDLSIEILKKSKDLKISPMVFASFNQAKNTSRFLKGDWWDPQSFKPLDGEFKQFLHEPIISIQYCDRKERLDQFYEEAKDKFPLTHILYFEDHFLPGYYWLEFNPKNAKKEIMVKKLIELKGYNPEDLIVFGDQINDIGMLKMGGIACVVENGVDSVKEIADYIVPSNKDGGVIQWLEENINSII